MNIGLKQAGLIWFVLDVGIKEPNAAKDEWARITGHLDPNWDKVKKTYCGWPVVRTRAKALQRKSNKPQFFY